MSQSTRWMLGEAWCRLEAGDLAPMTLVSGAQLQLPCQRNLHTHGEGQGMKRGRLSLQRALCF